MILRCTHCENISYITLPQGDLILLGLYPHRCKRCKALCPQVEHKAVKEVYGQG